jgi:hypothetical protein
METSLVVLGGVYQLSDVVEPVRVIAFDSHVVMYDTWWSHKNAWGMARLSGRYSYYRLTTDYFGRHSRYLRTEALTENEIDVHRPDLPFALAQHSDLSWYEAWGGDGFASDLPQGGSSMLDAQVVYLIPFGPKNGQKPAVVVRADNGAYFYETELLLRAHEVQRPHTGEVRLTRGVGIYRSGIQGKLPSYYVWGSLSRLEGACNAV